ncbi:MAG TPA: DinB family protein [Bryobacteraceae bacterium]|nr:DinB family protein [Bryobacteraceae bacterium]
MLRSCLLGFWQEMDARGKSEAARLSAVVLSSLDEEGATRHLASRAYWSRTHFHRLFRGLVEETPGAMRRRLLLERAAWQLGRTQAPVTEIAFDALYGSLEAFTRAFRRAFGISPSLYRRMGATHFRLSARNGIHFAAPGSPAKGEADMDLFDRFAGYESWHTRRLLDQAAKLSDEQLDRPFPGAMKILPWEKPEQTLRELLEGVVYTKEVWTAALKGREWKGGERKKSSPTEMRARYDKADADFDQLMREVRDTRAWDDTFVDALCEPPETFTFGGMFAHLMIFNSYKRLTALAVLRQLGVDDGGFGCPTEYEAEVAPWRVEEAVKK